MRTLHTHAWVIATSFGLLACGGGNASPNPTDGGTEASSFGGAGTGGSAGSTGRAGAAGGGGSAGELSGSGGSPEVGASVPQWSTYEVTMTSAATYTNAYTDVAVRAQVTGPGGVTQQVPGFWDGGSTFKVKFTPTLQGTWSYSITSSPSNPGLTRSGSFDVGAPAAGSHGFLRRDPSHPHSFVFDDQKRFFMMGQTYYGLILNALDNGDWQTSVRMSKSCGFTKIRLLLFDWPPGSGSSYGHPYAKPFTSDHDHPNLAYWQEMGSVIAYIEAQGMVADLILFADNSEIWGTSEQNDRYVRYAIARYASYPNLTWCISNEWNYTGQPQSEIDHLGSIVADEDPYASEGGARRPLSVHQQTRIDFQFFGSAWPSHAIVQYGPRNGITDNGDEWGNSGIRYNYDHGMPVVNDEYAYLVPYSTTVTLNDGTVFHETREMARNAIWGIVTAGGYGTFGGDGNLFSPDSKPIFSGDWLDEPGAYGDIRVLSKFFSSIPYWTMSPANDIVSGNRVYALGTQGNYVVYAAAGGTFSVNLDGSCSVTRLDPRTGESTTLASKPPGPDSITAPDTQDYVYHLVGPTCR